MAIHVATIGMVQVDASGNILTGTYTIKQRITANTEMRVLPNTNIPNSAAYPTIENYLIAEQAGGFKFKHIDQNIIITES